MCFKLEKNMKKCDNYHFWTLIFYFIFVAHTQQDSGHQLVRIAQIDSQVEPFS